MSDDAYKVLVVDDEYWARKNICKLVSICGTQFAVDSAENGEDALNKITERHPDILITDINMPLFNGLLLTEKVKNCAPDIVTIIISGYDNFDYVRTTLLNGAVDYLLKPVTKDNVWNVLNKALEKITEKKQDEKERLLMREKISAADAAMFDRQKTRLIQYKTDAQLSLTKEETEYELRYSGFTLVVIHLPGFADVCGITPDVSAQNVKTLITDTVGTEGVIVFHNMNNQSEFILISHTARRIVEQQCRMLLTALQRFTHACCTVVLGEYCYTFAGLPEAYRKSEVRYSCRVCSNRSLVCGIQEKEGTDTIPPVAQHLSVEQRKQLQIAVADMNRELFSGILVESGIFNCDEYSWSIAEVKQTVDTAIVLLRNATDLKAPDKLADFNTISASFDNTIEKGDLRLLQEEFKCLLDLTFGTKELLEQSNCMQKKIVQIRQYIAEHYSENLSLSYFAEKFFIEPTYLSRSFKSATGVPLMNYIATVRVKKAAEFILLKKMNIAEVAQLVGYDDYAYFNRVFKKITGKNPTQYQKEIGT